MKSRDTTRYAIAALQGAKSRTALMLLAMAIGVAAVLVLTSLGEAARRYVSAEFSTLGTNLIIVLPGRSETAGGAPFQLFGGTVRDLTLDDALALTRSAAVRRMAPIFKLRLEALGDHPLVGQARAIGLLGALELVKDKRTKQSFEPKLGVGAKAVRFAEEEGLLCRPVGGDNVALCPPLVIEGAEINAMFDMLGRALDKTEAWARAEGHL
jgi:hypothetical protein